MRPPGRDEDRNLLYVSKVDESKMDVALWSYKWGGLGLDGMDESLGGVKYGVPYGAKTFRDVGKIVESNNNGNKMGIGWFEHDIVSVQCN